MKYIEKQRFEIQQLKQNLSEQQIQNINNWDHIASKKGSLIVAVLMFTIFLPISAPCYICFGVYKVFSILISFVLKNLIFMEEDYWRYFFLKKEIKYQIQHK